MTLSETTTMATDTSSPGNHTQEPNEEWIDDSIGQDQQEQQSDGPTQQDKLRQRTLALVKPDAVQANHQQAIIDKIISAGFTIIQQKQVQFTLAQACLFYREHENKPFYDQLTEWMSSAPIYAMVLEKENAIQDWRSLMGPTNAIKAREIDPTSIRALFGTDGSHNATHGSDCLTSAEREIDIVFGSDQSPSTSLDSIVTQSDLSTASTSLIPTTDYDGSLDDNTSNKDQPSAMTEETDSSDNVLNIKATTATDDSAPFVPPTAATSLDTNNDVEHPVITSDSLSHPVSPDHDDAKNNNDAPTCPKSDFVELPSGDIQSASVTTANTIQDEHIESTATKDDVQEPIPQANVDNKDTAHVNSNIDETLQQHESQNDAECNHDSLVADASLSDQHQHQQQEEPSSPVTANPIAQELELVVDQSTPDEIRNALQQNGDKDQVASQDSAGLDISRVAEKVDEQEKDDDKTTEEPTTKASETTTTTTLAADDNITETTDHGADTTVDNSTTNDTSTIDEATVEKLAQQINQDLKLVDDDDDHNVTPEQETESLAIQEANNATPTTNIDTKDINDEKEGVNENHQSIDTTLAATSNDIKSTDIVPAESTIHDSDKTTDDRQQLVAAQYTENTVDEHHDDGRIETTGGNFDTIPLAADEEESKEVTVTVNNAQTTGEPVEDTANTLIESSPDVTLLERPASVENPTAPAEVTEKHADTVTVEQESKPANVVNVEPESVNGPGEPEPTENAISEVAGADEHESTQESIPKAVVVDESGSTKVLATADELEGTQESISADIVVDEIGNIKESSVDDELQSTEEANHGDDVTDRLGSTGREDEPEATKEHTEPAVVDKLLETVEAHIPAPIEKQPEHAEIPESQNTTETEASDIEATATDKSATTETEVETDDKNQKDTAPATTTVKDETNSVPNDDHQVKEIETATVDKNDSVSGQDENSAIDSTKATKSDEEPVKEKKAASTNHPASTARTPESKKSPSGAVKAPVKSTSPPTATKKSPTSATGTTKASATTRLRRPGTTSATGTGMDTTSTTGTTVKKATPKTSTSPGRTPLPRVASLAKKPTTKATEESKPTTETKPATATKKRSSVISRLTAPTAASANKRTSETASTAKTTSGNGTTTRTRVASGHHAPGTTAPAARRPVSKVPATSATDKPVTARRTSPSSTVDKTSTATARRTSPPSSTTVHVKTARSAAPASSSRLSSTTTKSPSTDPTAAKRSPARRVSPPTSTHLTSTTKPAAKVNKPANPDKKNDVIRKKTKPSGATTTTKTVKDATHKSDSKEKEHSEDGHSENTHSDDGTMEQGEHAKADEDTGDHVAEEKEEGTESGQYDQDSTLVVETTIQQQEETTTTTDAITTTTHVDDEVTTTTTGATLNPTATDSSNKRPKTPEMAQLRNKFENLQAPSTVTPTRSSNKQPSAPHNIKDLISRFN